MGSTRGIGGVTPVLFVLSDRSILEALLGEFHEVTTFVEPKIAAVDG
jgi:hypothetical protein